VWKRWLTVLALGNVSLHPHPLFPFLLLSDVSKEKNGKDNFLLKSFFNLKAEKAEEAKKAIKAKKARKAIKAKQARNAKKARNAKDCLIWYEMNFSLFHCNCTYNLLHECGASKLEVSRAKKWLT
jgi:hypothetical protein